MIHFREQIREMFRRMTGRVPRGHQQFAESEFVAIFYFFVLESVGRVAFMTYENRR